jgi:hypothetical protein
MCGMVASETAARLLSREASTVGAELTSDLELDLVLMSLTGAMGLLLVGWALAFRLATMEGAEVMILAGLLLCYWLLGLIGKES